MGKLGCRIEFAGWKSQQTHWCGPCDWGVTLSDIDDQHKDLTGGERMSWEYEEYVLV